MGRGEGSSERESSVYCVLYQPLSIQPCNISRSAHESETIGN